MSGRLHLRLKYVSQRTFNAGVYDSIEKAPSVDFSHHQRPTQYFNLGWGEEQSGLCPNPLKRNVVPPQHFEVTKAPQKIKMPTKTGH